MPNKREPITASGSKRAIGYCRVSRDKHEGATVARQRKLIEAFCKSNGFTMIAVFEDNDISASHRSRKERPDYRRALAMLESGQADLLVCYNLDRLWRQPVELEHSITVAERLAREGRAQLVKDGNPCAIATLHGFIDLTTPQGKLTARTLVMVGAMEADLISQRVSDQKRERRENGLPGSIVALGWRTPMEQEPEEVAVMRKLADGLLAGTSLRMLAASLTEQGVKQKRGGNGWTASLVKQMLRAPHHAGLHLVDGELRQGVWEPIFDRETWDRIQAELDRRGDRRRNPRNVSAFGGIVHCGDCGAAMWHARSAGRDRFRCPTRHYFPGTDKCSGMSMDGKAVVLFVTEYVLTQTDGKDLARLAKRQSMKGLDKEITRVQRELARVEALRSKVVDDVESGVSPYRSGMELARRHESTIAALQGELTNLYALDGDSATEYVSTPGLLREHWAEMSDDDKRAAITGVLGFIGKRVTIDKAKVPGSKPDVSRIRFADV